MPIGKDSIQKRVAKTTAPETETEIAAITETAEAPKPAPKKRAPVKQKSDTAGGADKPKTSAKKKPVPAQVEMPAETSSEPVAAPVPTTAVMGNVAPETVEKVIGHAEGTPSDHVQIGQKMPSHLL